MPKKAVAAPLPDVPGAPPAEAPGSAPPDAVTAAPGPEAETAEGDPEPPPRPLPPPEPDPPPGRAELGRQDPLLEGWFRSVVSKPHLVQSMALLYWAYALADENREVGVNVLARVFPRRAMDECLRDCKVMGFIRYDGITVKVVRVPGESEVHQ